MSIIEPHMRTTVYRGYTGAAAGGDDATTGTHRGRRTSPPTVQQPAPLVRCDLQAGGQMYRH